MDNPFEVPSAHRAVYDQAFRYGRERLYPLLERMDNDDWYPPDLMRELGANGYLGITADPGYGGAGADLFTAGMVCEAFGYWNTNAVAIWGPHENLCLNNILRNGSEAQKRRYAPKMISGEWVGALGLTEPGAGSDALGGMRTTAVRSSDGGHYVLNGGKTFISNGPVADVLLVYAKTAPERGPKGISAFIVEKGLPGFSVGPKFRKMGWRGAPTGELFFDDCRVPAANRLGEENAGVGIVMSGLNLERAFLALGTVGECQRCLDLALAHAAQRRQFGQAIGQFQMVQSHLAEMYTEIESARQLCYKVLWACNDLERGGGGRGDIHLQTAAALFKVGEVNVMVADKAVQIFGGSGFMWDSEINRHYRNAKLTTIGGGTAEVRKTIIAQELLRRTGA
ncbi:MAG: acyl-CoA dehydrogenase family protein [Burkholderiales bacterium]|nr:acyl-CoA dehydrogenase family protein [Burkholderiales bacterium]